MQIHDMPLVLYNVQPHAFLTAAGTPIKHASFISNLLSTTHLALIKVKAHGSPNTVKA